MANQFLVKETMAAMRAYQLLKSQLYRLKLMIV